MGSALFGSKLSNSGNTGSFEVESRKLPSSKYKDVVPQPNGRQGPQHCYTTLLSPQRQHQLRAFICRTHLLALPRRYQQPQARIFSDRCKTTSRSQSLTIYTLPQAPTASALLPWLLPLNVIDKTKVCQLTPKDLFCLSLSSMQPLLLLLSDSTWISTHENKRDRAL
ncbi:hypothetical protein ACFX2F_006827 [Malus domestica]